MSASSAVDVARKALVDEVFSSTIYHRVAGMLREETSRARLVQMAKMESAHSQFWLGFIQKREREAHLPRASRLKLYSYILMTRLFGLGLALPLFEKGEREAVELYSAILDRSELDDSELVALRRILEDELIHEQDFVREESKIEELLVYVRDAVLGMNDGLVEILSVTSGLAGAYGNSLYVALGGLVVAVAGALSMGVGVFTSVRAQRQVHESVLEHIGHASRHVAHLFAERIFHRLVEKGYSKEISKAIAKESSGNHRLLSRIVAEEEYGLSEESLANPRRAGLYSGVSNLLGAFIPLTPYLLGLPILIAIVSSVILAGVALACTGFFVAVSASLNARQKILEMVLTGLGSATATYIIGRAISLLLSNLGFSTIA